MLYIYLYIYSLYIYIYYVYLPFEPTQGLKTSEFKLQGPPLLTVTSDLAGSYIRTSWLAGEFPWVFDAFWDDF